MSEFLPALNAIGVYKFKTPISTMVNTQAIYQCKSIRKISELIGSGVDVLATYYTPYGLTSVTLEEDKKNDISIVGLYSEKADWLYVPSSQLDAYPDSGGVPYRRMAYAIDMGPVEESFDLSILNEILSDVIYSNLGIRPDIRVVSLSKSAMVKTADHEAIKAMRQGKIEIENTTYMQLAQLKDELASARLKIRALEDFIVQKNLAQNT